MNCIIFSQLMTSRLCHDLVGPIGSIDNCLELLQESSSKDSDILINLIRQSSLKALARLVYYRASLGYSSIYKLTNTNELINFIKNFLDSLKIDLLWRHTGDQQNQYSTESMTEGQIRVLLNVILLISANAPNGGQLIVNCNPPEKTYSIILVGQLSLLKPEYSAALQGRVTQENYNPQIIQAVLTGMLLKEHNLTLSELMTTKESLSIQLAEK